MNEVKSAIEYLEKAVESCNSIRHLLETSYSLKISLLDTQQNTFKLLQVVLVADNQIPRSLETSEEGRTRAFVDLLTSRLPYSVVNAPPIKWNEIQQLATKCTLVEYSVNNEPQEGKQDTKHITTSAFGISFFFCAE